MPSRAVSSMWGFGNITLLRSPSTEKVFFFSASFDVARSDVSRYCNDLIAKEVGLEKKPCVSIDPGFS